MTVNNIVELLEKKIPTGLAYSWDNVGLLVGEMSQTVDRVLLTLDVSPKVIDYAIQNNYDMIVSHHPLFRSAMKRINNPSILKLIRNNIALYTAHTNLDLVSGGVNSVLADKFKLKKRRFIAAHSDVSVYHIAVYTPPEDIDSLKEAVFAAGAGIIGNYSDCCNTYPVSGQFKPLEESNPAVGSIDEKEEVSEVKLEFFADSTKLSTILAAMISAHSYETPAYSVYPLHQQSQNYGLGIIGELTNPLTIAQLVAQVKDKLEIPCVKLWLAGKELANEISTVAVCGGSGSSLLQNGYLDADIFISSDFNYHTIIDSKIPLIDAGHFHTEYPVMKKLQELLKPLTIHTDIYPQELAEINSLKYI